MNIKHNFFKNTFFPSTIIEWNKLDPATRNSTSFNSFKESILRFIRLAPSSIFQCQNPKGIKYLKRLRVTFSHLRDHKFKHSFQDTINPLCFYSLKLGTTNHLTLHCPYYENKKKTFYLPAFAASKAVFWIKMIITKLKHFFIDLITLVKHRTQAF